MVIDGKYLDANEAELKAVFQKWRNEWHENGVTIMCDSWIGLTRMSVINFFALFKWSNVVSFIG
jgi:hypothetical protein